MDQRCAGYETVRRGQRRRKEHGWKNIRGHNMRERRNLHQETESKNRGPVNKLVKLIERLNL